MNLKLQWVALSTHLQLQVRRMCRIPFQVFLPSLLTTVIYFLIFGEIIGNRIGKIDGVSYSLYITPGLILISVISNSYVNVSASLYSSRFQRSVEELLISPMHSSVFMLGYVLGGVFRGVAVALIVIAVSAFFVDIHLQALPYTFLVIILFSSLFSLVGFTNGMVARTFDDVSIIPTFVLSPLTYLGGVFYSINMLPPLWNKVALFNPIYYMVDALRYVMLGHSSSNIVFSITCICGLILLTITLNMYLLRKGFGIRA
jgi:ABC-2 type transport system permease protein